MFFRPNLDLFTHGIGSFLDLCMHAFGPDSYACFGSNFDLFSDLFIHVFKGLILDISCAFRVQVQTCFTHAVGPCMALLQVWTFHVQFYTFHVHFWSNLNMCCRPIYGPFHMHFLSFGPFQCAFLVKFGIFFM